MSTDQFETQAIHAGRRPDLATGAILTPIHQSTTFVQDKVGEHKGWTYSRAGNPTLSALEENLAALEGVSIAGVSFATGMAAVTSLMMSHLKAGDHVICSDVVYGGTVRLLQQILNHYGVESSFIDTTNIELLSSNFQSNTRLVLIETPANPTMKVTDIRAVAQVCQDKNVPLAVDNTFLTAAGQKPLELGADIVLYSTTKYIEGHNTTVGGAIISEDQGLIDDLRFHAKTLGCPQAPFEAWLTLRGIKTLPIRLKQHSDNALKVAQFLEQHPLIDHVAYPFLESFPQYDIAKSQQSVGGGMMSFELVGGVQAGMNLMHSVKLCSLAENLGAVETLITHPVSMTHGDVDPVERQKVGITDGLVRLSVGLEHPDDIIRDLEQALDKVKS